MFNNVKKRMYNKVTKKMYNKILNIICIFACQIIYSQTDIYNLKNSKKFDSILNIKKKMDKEAFKKSFFSIQVFSGNFKDADSITNFVKEKYLNDSAYFYFETPNYKVRIGKFKSKIRAEKKLKLLKKEFKSAFILQPDKQ